jgi:threonyl-tRNA synthetase
MDHRLSKNTMSGNFHFDIVKSPRVYDMELDSDSELVTNYDQNLFLRLIESTDL